VTRIKKAAVRPTAKGVAHEGMRMSAFAGASWFGGSGG